MANARRASALFASSSSATHIGVVSELGAALAPDDVVGGSGIDECLAAGSAVSVLVVLSDLSLHGAHSPSPGLPPSCNAPVTGIALLMHGWRMIDSSGYSSGPTLFHVVRQGGPTRFAFGLASMSIQGESFDASLKPRALGPTHSRCRRQPATEGRTHASHGDGAGNARDRELGIDAGGGHAPNCFSHSAPDQSTRKLVKAGHACRAGEGLAASAKRARVDIPSPATSG
jgi:hypothetical protein